MTKYNVKNNRNVQIIFGYAVCWLSYSSHCPESNICFYLTHYCISLTKGSKNVWILYVSVMPIISDYYSYI